jgi:hypothetical protein
MAANFQRFQISDPPRYEISSEIHRRYRHFNAMVTELIVHPLPPTDSDGTDPMTHFIDTINEILGNAMHDRDDSVMVGLQSVMTIT